jgi:hypothetical protein
MARVATRLGYAEDATRFTRLANAVRTAWRREFMQGGRCLVTTQTGLSCALYQGLVDPEEQATVIAQLLEAVQLPVAALTSGVALVSATGLASLAALVSAAVLTSLPALVSAAVVSLAALLSAAVLAAATALVSAGAPLSVTTVLAALVSAAGLTSAVGRLKAAPLSKALPVAGELVVKLAAFATVKTDPSITIATAMARNIVHLFLFFITNLRYLYLPSNLLLNCYKCYNSITFWSTPHGSMWLGNVF